MISLNAWKNFLRTNIFEKKVFLLQPFSALCLIDCEISSGGGISLVVKYCLL